MSKRLCCPKGQNNLLFTLPPEDRAVFQRHLEPVMLPAGEELEQAGEVIERVYFPVEGVASMIAVGGAGRRIEAGLYGREGMSGTAVVLHAVVSPHDTFMQVPGRGLVMQAETLRDLLRESESARRHMLRFAQALMTQTAQTALSNGRAKLEERLARWLLMCHDRVDGDSMDLTHEFLSVMLGVRRAGVTVGTHMLEGKGLIRANRGNITVLDREGLETIARPSYGVPEEEYARLIA